MIYTTQHALRQLGTGIDLFSAYNYRGFIHVHACMLQSRGSYFGSMDIMCEYFTVQG